ncbi:4Fe-4S dicluster domain-containing protein [Symbiobacterium terraclitae]|uniref:4Fe-4S dicluster domain-containing protein n=1 Tax=Symbiobacterium terraclitae TaxID=557451 RepID=UPI0035B52D9D
MARAPRRFTIAVNPAYCKGCEICVQICPKQVLRLGDRQKVVVQAAGQCTGCGNCEIYCPDFAIEVSELEEVGAHA